MRNGKVVIVCMAILLLTAGPLHAGIDTPAIEKGTKEIGFEVMYIDTDAEFDGHDLGSVSQFSFSGSLGYFITKYHEVGAGLSYEKVDNGDDTSSFIIGASYTFNLTTVSETIVPVIGGQIGVVQYDMFDESESGIFWRIHGGMRFLPVDNVSINVGVGYQSESPGDFDLTAIGVIGGISFLF